MQKLPHIIIPLHNPTPKTHPSVHSIAPPLRLTVLETNRLQQLHASRAGEFHRRFRPPRRVFEVVVEAPPRLLAELGCGSGDGVEGVAYEMHVCDGGRGEVGGYLGDHFGGEGEEG